MTRQARYDDYVTYDADPVEEAADERFDPKSGRPMTEIGEFFRARAKAELVAIRAMREQAA